MSEPVTIGNQTFIKDPNRGWIDQKTKAKADPGLTRVLDSLDLKPAEKKLRVKIDRKMEPVTVAGQTFVFDMNSSSWIDSKTKIKAPESLQKVITQAVNDAAINNVLGIDAATAAAGKVAESFGAVGNVAKSKVRQKAPTRGGGTIPSTPKRVASARQINSLNPLIISMINHLASIDVTLKNMNALNIAIARNVQDQIDENNIENQQDQFKIIEGEDNNQQPTKVGSSLLLGGVGAILIASYIDPIAETITKLVDYTVAVGSAVNRMAGAVNDFFGMFSGGGESEEGGGAASTSSKNATPSAAPGTTPKSTSATPAPAAAPGTNSSTVGNTSTPSAKNPVRPASAPVPASAPAPSSSSSAAPLKPTVGTSSAQRPAMSAASSSAPPPQATASSSKPAAARAAPAAAASPASTSAKNANRQAAPAASATSPNVAVSPSAKNTSWFDSAPKGTVWQGGGWLIKKDFNGTYTIKSKGNEPVTGESASNALYYILANKLKSSTTNNDPPGATAVNQDGYINPVQGYSVNSGYGMRMHPVKKTMAFHTGVDIAAPAGTPVRAARAGRVTKVEFAASGSGYGGFGNIIIVDHGDGYQSVYAHLSKFACRVGDDVQQGQIIGYVGSTGMSTGPHLHFIMQRTGHATPSKSNTIDPASLTWTDGTTIPASMEGYTMESDGADGSSLLTMSAEAIVKGIQFMRNTFAGATATNTEFVDYSKIQEFNSDKAVAERANKIQAESAKMFGDKVESATPATPPPPVVSQAANLNMNAPELAAKGQISPEDRSKILQQYFKYFGVKPIDNTKVEDVVQTAVGAIRR